MKRPDQKTSQGSQFVEKTIRGGQPHTCTAHFGGSPRGALPLDESEWYADTRATVVMLPLESITMPGSMGRDRDGLRTMTVIGPRTYTWRRSQRQKGDSQRASCR